MDKKVVATITVLNEQEIIGDILSRMPDWVDVIIVDDGSTDDTAKIARAHRAVVIKHPINLGQSMAFVTALRVALMHDYEIIIEMDGDGQHDPRDIPRFVDQMLETDCDIVVGSRRLGSSYKEEPFPRRVFLPPLTGLLNWVTGYELTDSMCGYRAFKADSLRKHTRLLQDIERQYAAAELFIRFSKVGFTVTEIPIHLKKRQHGASYKGLVRYGWGVARSIVRGIRWRNIVMK